MLWTPDKHYLNDPFEAESEIEAAIIEVANILFGQNRIYLDVKKLIGATGKTKNIPDGYLIDLTSKKEPRLFVVENELASHDPLKHVAVQILEFSLSFESSHLKLKGILKDALKSNIAASQLCINYAKMNGFENLDYLIERMLHKENAFNALVIIDELEDELETLLLKSFKFPVEVLTLRRLKTKDGQKAYQFEPFLVELCEPSAPGKETIDPAELDTVVVPAQQEGFMNTFLGENRWYAIRIHSSMVPKIKYIAAYRVRPDSAITHTAQVKNIEQWQDSSKYLLNFTEPAKEIKPLKLVPKPNGIVKTLQSPRYTSYARLIQAKNLDEVF